MCLLSGYIYICKICWLERDILSGSPTGYKKKSKSGNFSSMIIIYLPGNWHNIVNHVKKTLAMSKMTTWDGKPENGKTFFSFLMYF